MRTRPCNAVTRRGRLRKAEQFLDAANTVRDIADENDEVSDAYVTLCVHAGIAAADVICCARLGEHALGESHTEASALLKMATPDSARHLGILLDMKTKAGYSDMPVSMGDAKRAERAATALVEAARRANTAAGA